MDPHISFFCKKISVCVYALHLSQHFYSPVFLGWTSTKKGVKCLAQGHNTVSLPEVILELPTLQSSDLRLYQLSHCALPYLDTKSSEKTVKCHVFCGNLMVNITLTNISAISQWSVNLSHCSIEVYIRDAVFVAKVNKIQLYGQFSLASSC